MWRGRYVSAEPDVSSISLEKDDEFVVLASDGVYDVFDNDQARAQPSFPLQPRRPHPLASRVSAAAVDVAAAAAPLPYPWPR